MSFSENPYTHILLTYKNNGTGAVGWECESCGHESPQTWNNFHAVGDIINAVHEHLHKSHNTKPEDFEYWG